jgi:hypothetical protein
MMADIISRENYELAKQSGLRITRLGDKLSQREETFMSNFMEKIPGIGFFFKGSDRAYSGFLNQLRMDAYDRLINDARLNGEDVRPGSKTAIDAANIVNNFTGAGSFGNKKSISPWLSTIFFSPRRTMSIINNANPLTYMSLQSNTVRKYAIARLLSLAGVVAMIGAFAKLDDDDDIDFETDIRSTNFGKLKWGRTWIDITSGNARFLNVFWTGVLAGIYNNLFKGENKLLFGKKDSATGVVKPVGKTSTYESVPMDVIESWVRNKLAPIPGLIVDMYKGADFKGEEFDITDEAEGLFISMSLSDMLEWNDGTITGKEAIAGTILNIIGLNTYVQTNNPNWQDKNTKELVRLRDAIGDKEFSNAIKMYGKLYTERLDELVGTKEYQALDNDGKKKAIDKLKREIKKAVFNRYGVKTS